MAALAEAQLLDLVEHGAALTPLDRAVLLVAALERVSQDEASAWPVDERDRSLLAGRRGMFGAALPFVTRCRSCGETMEGSLDSDVLLAAEGTPDGGLRAPSSRDLADAARAGDPGVLVARCAPAPGPAPVDLEARLERAFPLLDVRVELACEACGATIAERFDVVRYFWDELERHATNVLDDVHALARAYGWSEADILALGPARRRAYLARVTA